MIASHQVKLQAMMSLPTNSPWWCNTDIAARNLEINAYIHKSHCSGDNFKHILLYGVQFCWQYIFVASLVV